MRVVDPEGNELTLSMMELQNFLKFQWLSHLQFSSLSICRDALKHSAYSMKKKELSRRESFLSVHYEKEIFQGKVPPVYIKWIDSIIGYGVFAQQPIPSGVFVGEYTGTVRRRRKRKDRSNDYTFEYTIGDWRANPYIIDAKEKGNHTRFINHEGLTPNVEPLSLFAGGVMHIILKSRKKIKKDEQLAYNYGDIFWKKRSKEVRVFDY